MSDNAQAGSQTGSGPTFRTLADSGNVQHPAAVLEYVITLSAGANVLQPVKIDTGLPVQPQTGAVFPVSAAALPLPAGAATAAKQPALGTAGTPSADVISIQGSTGMTPVQASLKPQTSGGLTPYHLIAAGTTNATSVKGSAGQLYAYYLSNVSASPRYVKFFDKASAPTLGTDTPVLTLMLPGNSAGSGANNAIPNGIAFANGIAIAITANAADNDNTGVTASDVIVNLMYA
jgi:hypothetical protein